MITEVSRRVIIDREWFNLPGCRSFISHDTLPSGCVVRVVTPGSKLAATCVIDVSIAVRLTSGNLLLHVDSGGLLNGVQTRILLRSCGVTVNEVPASTVFAVNHCSKVVLDDSKVVPTGDSKTHDDCILQAIRAAAVEHGVGYNELIVSNRRTAPIRQKIWYTLDRAGVPISLIAKWFLREYTTVYLGIQRYAANEAMKPQRTKWISSISDKRKANLKQYEKLKRVWLKGRKCCYPGCNSLVVDVHHLRGRIGKLLCEQRYWLPLCRPHHDWVGRNPEEARKMGLLCEKGKWNTYE